MYFAVLELIQSFYNRKYVIDKTLACNHLSLIPLFFNCKPSYLIPCVPKSCLVFKYLIFEGKDILYASYLTRVSIHQVQSGNSLENGFLKRFCLKM